MTKALKMHLHLAGGGKGRLVWFLILHSLHDAVRRLIDSIFSFRSNDKNQNLMLRFNKSLFQCSWTQLVP